MLFDITKTPPTAIEISSEKLKLEGLLKKRIWMSFVCFVFSVVIVGCEMTSFLSNDNLSSDDYLTYFILATFVGLTIVFVVFRISRTMGDLRKEIDSLTLIEIYECRQVIEWCKQSDACNQYQSSVAQQGRQLILGEYVAMEAWVTGSCYVVEMEESQNIHLPLKEPIRE